jgi:hypothetical protein
MSHIQNVVTAEIEAERQAAIPKKVKKWNGLGLYMRDIRENVKARFPSLGNDFNVQAVSDGPNPDYRVTFKLRHLAVSSDIHHDLSPSIPRANCDRFSLDWGPTLVKNITTDKQLREAVRKIIDRDQAALEAQCRALSEPCPYAIGNTD